MTSATYGACYSINSNISGKAKALWRSSLPGPDLGLTIVVNLEQNQYLQKGITKSAGARFVSQQAPTGHGSSSSPFIYIIFVCVIPSWWWWCPPQMSFDFTFLNNPNPTKVKVASLWSSILSTFTLNCQALSLKPYPQNPDAHPQPSPT